MHLPPCCRWVLSLNKLGQRDDACATLGEVTNRFPEAAASLEAQTARAQPGLRVT